jgi:FdhD protein
MTAMSDMARSFDVVRVRGNQRSTEVDRAATEEPLEIRLHNRPFSVVMRTPGSDRELVAGFLLAEQVIRGSDDLGTIAHCTDGSAGLFSDVDSRPAENVVNVTLVNGSADSLDRLLSERRQVTTNASCGLCGRRTIESLIADVPPLPATWAVPSSVLASLPYRLRVAQTVFDETGGCTRPVCSRRPAISSNRPKMSDATTPSTRSWAACCSARHCRSPIVCCA